MHQGEAMMPKRWPSPRPKQCNGHHRHAPVELLSARIVRLRIARGYSAYELATAAGVFAGTIKCLESGKPADKRVLPALARALGVPVAGSCAASTTASNGHAWLLARVRRAVDERFGVDLHLEVHLVGEFTSALPRSE